MTTALARDGTLQRFDPAIVIQFDDATGKGIRLSEYKRRTLAQRRGSRVDFPLMSHGEDEEQGSQAQAQQAIQKKDT